MFRYILEIIFLATIATGLIQETSDLALLNPRVCRLHIRRRASMDYCIGVYVAPSWILTATACLDKRAEDGKIMELLICTGAMKFLPNKCDQGMLGVKIVRHPEQDLVLVESDYDFDGGRFVQSRYVSGDPELDVVKEQYNHTCYAVAFKHAPEQVVPPLDWMVKYEMYLGTCETAHHVCMLNGSMYCLGNSGGPLFCRDTLVGILRYDDAQCNRSFVPRGGKVDVYTKVLGMGEFIEKAEQIDHDPSMDWNRSRDVGAGVAHLFVAMAILTAAIIHL